MVKRNAHFSRLQKSYLFPEVMRRAARFNDLISLSIGDTSEPIPVSITEAMKEAADQLNTHKGYRGYGSEQGTQALREKIAALIYKGAVSPDEIFISDGAKCDIGRLQVLFGNHATIAVQNPTYPVYVDTGLLLNQNVLYMECLPENNFFPNTLPQADLIYLCSPNNPTGTVATHKQLHALVQWAKEHKAFIIFDAAYAGFIQDPSLPRSIYEIEGADEVAIEVSSFSKLVGFTGVRLGWSVVPNRLTYSGGGSVREDYTRVVTTFFNGASNISQAGGLAALDHPEEMERLCAFYLENARLIKEALHPKGFPIHGGENAPYLWVDFGKLVPDRKSFYSFDGADFVESEAIRRRAEDEGNLDKLSRTSTNPGGKRCPSKPKNFCGQALDSWDLFQMLLQETRLITTPGSGFGSCGEGFIRFSAFGNRDHILQAVKRIETQWPEQLSLLPI